MKICFYDWAGSAKNLPDWFKHNTEEEVQNMVEVFRYVRELYAAGNNVMLAHRGDDVIVYVDDKRFTQR